MAAKKGTKSKSKKPQSKKPRTKVETEVPEGSPPTPSPRHLMIDFSRPASVRVALGLESEEEALARQELYDFENGFWGID